MCYNGHIHMQMRVFSMALSSKIKVPKPENGTTTRGTGKYRYVYKVIRAYRGKNGKPTNERISIGRLDVGSGMLIPNDKYWEYFGETAPIISQDASAGPYDSIHSIGATFLVWRALETLGVAKILRETFGKEKAAAIMTASEYMVCRGNVFECVGDWCEGYTLHEPKISSQSSSSLFSSITYAERMSFFRSWVALQSPDEYYAYDVTSFSSYSTGLPDVEWGYNRDKDKLPQINFGCYLGQISKLPVFYVTYPGSIVDKSHLKYMMEYNETLGISGATFVMDRGFCKTDNIKYMHSSKLRYIMGVNEEHKAIRAAIDKARDGIISVSNVAGTGVYSRQVQGRFYGMASTLHVYYSPEMAEFSRQALYRKVEMQEETLSQLGQLTQKEAKSYRKRFKIIAGKDGAYKYERDCKKIDEESKNCGFFCILTNLGKSGAETLSIYRRKDTIEKGFDDIKNFIDMKRLRTHSAETTDGKMFCAFVALIAASGITNKLSGFLKDNSMSKDALISELEKIRVVIMPNGGRLTNPLTKTQRTIFETCGISEDELASYINGNDLPF